MGISLEYNRVLITGCGGMLGNAIYPYFKGRCAALLATDIEIEHEEGDWLHFLDTRDDQAMHKVCTEFKPDLILHLAALTDLEFCELHPKDAEASCADTARIAAECAAKNGATLVYISTAGVFDGKKGDGLYSE